MVCRGEVGLCCGLGQPRPDTSPAGPRQSPSRSRGVVRSANTKPPLGAVQACTRVWQRGRLLYFTEQAKPKLWDDYWSGLITRGYYEKYEHGELDELAPFAEKLFAKEDRILDAGCGSARFVVALLSRGFRKVEGIDCGQETIDRVRTVFPDLPVRVGDAMRIDRQDDYYDGYISLGVVEHREEGPEPYLCEACRVLKPGGHAFFSVPYINPLRDLKHRIGCFRRVQGNAARFYQCAFSMGEFLGLLTEAGFEVIAARGVAGYHTLRQELPCFISLLKSVPGGLRVLGYLNSSGWIDRFGHMILFVCRKRPPGDSGASTHRPAHGVVSDREGP